MAVPKKRTSKRRRNMRRAHDALGFSAALEQCEQCGEVQKRHHACPSCGTYRGHQMIEVVEEEI